MNKLYSMSTSHKLAGLLHEGDTLNSIIEFIIKLSMGNQLCVDSMKEQPLSKIQGEQRVVSLQLMQKEDQNKKKIKERTIVDSFPMVNKHVEERIKKLTRVEKNVGKIWKIRVPYNVIYANTDEKLEDELPKAYVQLYKLKENGDFQGYFQGTLKENFEPELNQSIFVYPNASYLVGMSSNEGIYTNEVTNLSYKGGWENEQPQGKGVESKNKGTYEGNYNLGQKEGIGKFEWSDSSTFEGSLLKGLFHGMGVIQDVQSKYSYEGEFQYGQKHGQGIEKSEFQFYQGSFLNGKRCGKGSLIINNPSDNSLKIFYQGNFFNDLPNGKGKLTKSKARAISGIWQSGRLISIILE